MTGLAGLTLTSATGAKFWLMPIAAQLVAGDRGGGRGRRGRAAGAERHVARQQRGRRADPGDDAVLLVGGDQQRHGLRWLERGALDAVGQTGDLVRVRTVLVQAK